MFGDGCPIFSRSSRANFIRGEEPTLPNPFDHCAEGDTNKYRLLFDELDIEAEPWQNIAKGAISGETNVYREFAFDLLLGGLLAVSLDRVKSDLVKVLSTRDEAKQLLDAHGCESFAQALHELEHRDSSNSST